MAYTTINKSTEHFNTITWSGTGSGKSETGVGFQPDWVWTKGRTLGGYNHYIVDAVRGSTKVVYSNLTEAEDTDSNGISAFGSDGYTFGTSNGYNNGSNTYVAWNWKAGGGQGSSNTAGSINTTYTSVNTTAGFSISTYTGNGSNNATIGHGLGAVPKMMIFKILSSADDWTVYHAFLGATKKLNLNDTGAASTVPQIFNDTEPTSSLITFGTHSRTNSSGGNYVCYAFAEKTGYSKFGSYTGGGSDGDGVFIYTGFKPAFVIIKKTSATGNWILLDSKRSNNVNQSKLFPDTNDAENTDTGNGVDLLSNGFKCRRNNGETNESGASYIYMAFAEAPLVGSNNVPCTAR